MKKILMLMIVAVLMLGISGQAMASFEEGHLIRVVYSGTGAGTEYVTDLGDFLSLTSPLTSNNALSGQNTFSLANVGASATWANTNVAYFIVSFSANAGAGAAWTSGPASGSNNNFGTFWTNFVGSTAMTTNSWQQYSGGANSVAVSQADGASYWINQNSGGTSIGTFMGYLTNTAEKNLGELATAAYVDQYLYYYGANPDGGTPGTQVAKLRTFADHTELGAVSQVLVPAAVYLFGTGQIGRASCR